MGLFSRNFDKPGPGVRKDEPRKKGAARFFELLFRDFWDLTKLSLLFCVCVIPTVVVFILGLMGFYTGYAFILSLILAFPVGGALVAFIYYITKMMRDDPSYVWYEFKRKFKENYRQAAPAGMLYTAFIYAQVLLWGSMIMSGEPGGDIIWFFIALLSLLIFGMITPYIFLHFAYIDLKTFSIIKNSVLMSFGYFPRSFMGAILGGLLWTVLALFVPLPIVMLFVPVIALFGIPVSLLLCLSWIWPPFDKHFKIEETLVKRLEDEGE